MLYIMQSKTDENLKHYHSNAVKLINWMNKNYTKKQIEDFRFCYNPTKTVNNEVT